MRCVDLIIFDLDGTLVDSRSQIANAVNFTLRALNIEERPFEEITSFIGMGARDLLRRSLRKENAQLLNEAVITFQNYYKIHSPGHASLYPHVIETLEYFKDKIKIIITNSPKATAEQILFNSGIDKYFKDIIGGDDESCQKPSACSLNKSSYYLKNSKDKIIIVGDMDIDVITGKSAGILTCAVTYGIGKKKDLVKAGPDYMIDDIIQLKEIIK
ncbi:MAG: HAD-IA family hydrolase [Candidatus Omnitrophica bacterium]|nr:HAD-IA family hydrolase [Candidatus Omnitrophota bacterium]